MDRPASRSRARIFIGADERCCKRLRMLNDVTREVNDTLMDLISVEEKDIVNLNCAASALQIPKGFSSLFSLMKELM